MTTRVLADWIVSQRFEDIPQDVRHEALRSLVNIVGCAVGGSTHPAMEITVHVRADLKEPKLWFSRQVTNPLGPPLGLSVAIVVV